MYKAASNTRVEAETKAILGESRLNVKLTASNAFSFLDKTQQSMIDAELTDMRN